jgi:hypothetical protein
MNQGDRRQFGGKQGGRPGGPPHSGPRGGRGGPDQDEHEIAQILKQTDKIDFWSGEQRKTLRPELLDVEAQNRARALSGVTSSQLRRFYGPTVAFKQRLEIDRKITDGEVEAQIAYLKASSAYAGAR